ncbi:zinc finger, CCHC-type containing protein [Tanacetum coccineum]
MDSIIGNNTWVLTDLPPGCRPLGCKWIFKRKLKVDETVEKFKARLVIQGFKQNSGRDYFDTYAPVAHISTIRLLIAIASIRSLIIHQMDVKTAFLNGKLDEDAYMNPGHENNVCKLIKSLYGLNKFDEFGKGVIICLYVDDMLIFGIDQVQVDLTKEFLSSRFSMKDMGEADVILGIRIKHESNRIAISQSHYIEKVLEKLNYFDCTPVSTPMDISEKLMPNNSQAISQHEYSRVIGCLMCWKVTLVQVRSATLKKIRLQVPGYSCLVVVQFFVLPRNKLVYGKEAEWLKNLLLEIPLWVKPIAPIFIRYDSAATLAKAYSHMYNGKSRHLGVRYSMIRELITNGVVSIEFVRS